MSHYKPYPAYKDSGIDWIGEVPEHWNVSPIKRVTKLKNLRTSENQNGVDYIGLEDVESESGKYLPTEGDSRQSEDSTVGVFNAGDVLYGKLRPYLKKAIVANFDGVCSTEFLVLNSIKVEPELLQKWLLTSDVTQQIESTCDGAKMPRADWEGVGNVPIPVPPNDEQRHLVETIKTETTRIDTLIAKKTRFIELLKEKRQALITHAVTKGLTPNVHMKDSDVEWIGKIPEHWEVKPFFSLLTELKRKNTGLVETNILSLSYGRVIQKSENRNMGLVPESYETYQIVEQGEVVFRFTDLQNDKRSLRSALVQERGIISSAYMAVNLRNIDSNYFSWLMRSYDLCKVFYGMGGGVRQSLKFEDVRRLQVLVPPKEEQAEIATHVNRQLAHNDSLVEKTERSINLLKERRSAFITAAVTGQIDLREDI